MKITSFAVPGTWLTLWFNMLAVAFFLIFQIPNVSWTADEKRGIYLKSFSGWDAMVELCAGTKRPSSPPSSPSCQGAVQERRP